MYIILALVVAAVGVIQLVNPAWVYQVTEHWKSNSDSEPSPLYLLRTRLTGGFLLLGGIAGAVILLICK